MIRIGIVTKPQGVKGELKLIPENQAERFLNLKSVFIDEKECNVFSIALRQGNLYLCLDNVKDRTSAELLRGKEVFAKEGDLEKLQENEFYFKDLIGIEVFDEKNSKVGELVDIEQYGAADVILIRERNIIFSVPFIEEIFVKIEPKRVIINRQKYDDIKIGD